MSPRSRSTGAHDRFGNSRHQDRQTFPLLFYRDNCADMAFCPDDVNESFIADCMALHITGTHFSTPQVRAGSLRALEYAHAHNVRTVLDIDYRPVLWGLTTPGDGKTRYIPSPDVTARFQEILCEFGLIVGTEEEFEIAGGTQELIVLARSPQTLGGDAGRQAQRARLRRNRRRYTGQYRRSICRSPARVEVLNVLGAGDAFLAWIPSGWLRGFDYDICCQRANACGALVVSRHSFVRARDAHRRGTTVLHRAHRHLTRPAVDSTLNWLHHVTPKRRAWNDIFVFAFDHRSQLYDLARQVGAPESRLPALKRLLVETVAHTEARLNLYGSVGALIDDIYGEDALHAATGETGGSAARLNNRDPTP